MLVRLADDAPNDRVPSSVSPPPAAGADQLEAALRTEAGDEHPAVEPIRRLIDRVILTPAANGPLHIRVEGKLNSLIGGGQYPAMSLGGIW